MLVSATSGAGLLLYVDNRRAATRDSMNCVNKTTFPHFRQQDILVAATGIEPARITRFELGHSAIRGNPRRENWCGREELNLQGSCALRAARLPFRVNHDRIGAGEWT